MEFVWLTQLPEMVIIVSFETTRDLWLLYPVLLHISRTFYIPCYYIYPVLMEFHIQVHVSKILMCATASKAMP